LVSKIAGLYKSGTELAVAQATLIEAVPAESLMQTFIENMPKAELHVHLELTA
jgi:hypothetical protein